MKKVVIDRAQWNAGTHTDVDSALLDSRGKRCCLGFLGVACGLDPERRAYYPRGVPRECAWPPALFATSSWSSRTFPAMPPEQWETFFAVLNDRDDFDDATRESWIATGFRLVLDREVVFVGEYPEAP